MATKQWDNENGFNNYDGVSFDVFWNDAFVHRHRLQVFYKEAGDASEQVAVDRQRDDFDQCHLLDGEGD